MEPVGTQGDAFSSNRADRIHDFDESSEARNNTVFATSSASPSRPSGMVRKIRLSRTANASGVGAAPLQIGVRAAPGATTRPS